jgi:hypothetical protein
MLNNIQAAAEYWPQKYEICKVMRWVAPEIILN